MGAAQSMPADNADNNLKAADILDILAAKYILTQNFKDMKRLGNKEYCNKLIILTADIIKKFLKEKDVTYMSQRIENGVLTDVEETTPVIYLSANKLKKQRDFKEREQEQEHKKQDPKPDFKISGEDMIDVVASSAQKATDKFTFVNVNADKEPSSRGNNTLLNQLDVQNPREKDKICKGIDKFYIKIAHLFAAILKTVNPIYKYDGHEMSIMNKSKIPKGAKVKLSEVNLCSRRIKALKVKDKGDGKVEVRVKNCNLNRKFSIKKVHREIFDNMGVTNNAGMAYNEKQIRDKRFGEEIGIPELEKLYYDIYDYNTGKFNSMSRAARGSYNANLQTFYTTFTGKNNYFQWNIDGTKKFADIPLIAYHNSDVCKKADSPWRQTYEGDIDNPLFQKFAANVKDMLQNTQNNQIKLLGILDKVFVWIEGPKQFRAADKPENEEDSLLSKMVTINPALTNKDLSDLVVKTRKLIINIYLQCEREYQAGLKIFEAIVGERILQNSIDKKKQLEQQLNNVIVGQDDEKLDALLDTTNHKMEKASNNEVGPVAMPAMPVAPAAGPVAMPAMPAMPVAAPVAPAAGPVAGQNLWMISQYI